MKKFAIGMAIGASLISSAALAGEQRPTYLAFSAPAATPVATEVVSPAAPRVAKRDSGLAGIPVGAAIILGIVAAASTGGNGSPG